jgi:hypothetical protein
MPPTNNQITFEKLRGRENYNTWKSAMRAALHLEDLWEMCDRRSHRRRQKHEGAIPNFASHGAPHLYPRRGCSDGQGRVEQPRSHFRGCRPKQQDSIDACIN